MSCKTLFAECWKGFFIYVIFCIMKFLNIANAPSIIISFFSHLPSSKHPWANYQQHDQLSMHISNNAIWKTRLVLLSARGKCIRNLWTKSMSCIWARFFPYYILCILPPKISFHRWSLCATSGVAVYFLGYPEGIASSCLHNPIELHVRCWKQFYPSNATSQFRYQMIWLIYKIACEWFIVGILPSRVMMMGRKRCDWAENIFVFLHHHSVVFFIMEAMKEQPAAYHITRRYLRLGMHFCVKCIVNSQKANQMTVLLNFEDVQMHNHHTFTIYWSFYDDDGWIHVNKVVHTLKKSVPCLRKFALLEKSHKTNFFQKNRFQTYRQAECIWFRWNMPEEAWVFPFDAHHELVHEVVNKQSLHQPPRCIRNCQWIASLLHGPVFFKRIFCC